MTYDRRFWITLAVMVAIALILLWGGHKAHIQSGLLWLLVLACPLMHLFMHHGRGGGGHGGHHHDSRR